MNPQTLFEQVLSNASAQLAQDLFLTHLFGGLAIGAGVFILLAFYLFNKTDEEDWCIGGVVSILVLVICGMVSIVQYSEVLQIRNSPETWARHRVAAAVEEVLR